MEISVPPSIPSEPRRSRVEVLVRPGARRPGHGFSFRPITQRPRLASLLAYGILLVLCGLIMTWRLELWQADLALPLSYGGDGLLHQLWAKAVIENGWYLHNDSLGMPFGMDAYDYPQSESLHLLLMKLLALAKPHYAFVFNAYALLSFPLVALAAYVVLRRLGVSYASALAASLLYTFLPYHFIRLGLHHYLTAYYLIPPVTLIAFRLFLDEDFLVVRDPEHGKTRFRFGKAGALVSLGVAVLVACAGVYYAFFSCYLLLAAGVAAAYRTRRYQPLLAATILILVVCGGILVNLIPNFEYFARHGTNPMAVRREPFEAELYGLKVVQLLLPDGGHPFSPLAQLGQRYARTAPPANTTSTLGILGGVGFLLLLGRVLLRRPSAAAPTVLDAAAFLNLALVLLATVGGFASLFSYLGCAWVREYARTGIFVGFLAFFGLAYAADQWARRKLTTRRSWLAFQLAVMVILGLGLWDLAVKTVGSGPAAYAGVRETYQSDAEFVRAIEASVPPRAMIYQLPYMPFYEQVPIHAMGDYEHLRGYFHSRTLRWSYGSMNGRPAGEWHRRVASQPPEKMVESLALAGFSGIYLNRAGFADRGAALEAHLARLLQVRPLVSRDGTLSFFPMTAYAERLKQTYAEAEWESARQATLALPLLVWEGEGFYGLEKGPAGDFHWCSAQGEFEIVNAIGRATTVRLQLICQTPGREPSQVTFESSLLTAQLEIRQGEAKLDQTVTVPPGRHRVRFRSNAPRVAAPGDPRELVFRIVNLSLTPGDPPPQLEIAKFAKPN